MAYQGLLLQVLCSQAEIQGCGLIRGSTGDSSASRIPQIVERIHSLVFSDPRLPFLSRSCLLFIERNSRHMGVSP